MKASLFNAYPEEILLPPNEYWEEVIEYDKCYLCEIEMPSLELLNYGPMLPHKTCKECVRIDEELVKQMEP